MFFCFYIISIVHRHHPMQQAGYIYIFRLIDVDYQTVSSITMHLTSFGACTCAKWSEHVRHMKHVCAAYGVSRINALDSMDKIYLELRKREFTKLYNVCFYNPRGIQKPYNKRNRTCFTTDPITYLLKLN